jgi:putative membrane protein
MKHFGLVFLMLVTAACNRTSETTVATTTDTATVTATTGTPATTETSTVPAADLEFATTASMANLYEIEAGKLAVERATGAAYKEFAQTMVTQHTEIGDSYKPIAEQQGLPMPATLTGQFKTLYDQLSATPSSIAFDLLYRQQMIDTHTTAAPLFQTEAATGQDTQLKAFAAKWAPTIQHHLEMAQALPPVQ